MRCCFGSEDGAVCKLLQIHRYDGNIMHEFNGIALLHPQRQQANSRTQFSKV